MTDQSERQIDAASLLHLTDEQLLAKWDDYQSGKLALQQDQLISLMGECFRRGLRLIFDFRKGQIDFEISDKDRRLLDDATTDPWIEPDCNRNDHSYLCAYGQSFRAYDFAEQQGFDLADLANARLHEYEQTGNWTGDFVTLRCCLFFEWRRVHFYNGLYPSSWNTIQSLFEAVCSAYRAETGSRSTH